MSRLSDLQLIVAFVGLTVGIVVFAGALVALVAELQRIRRERRNPQ